MMQPEQPEQGIGKVALKDLPGFLRVDMGAFREKYDKRPYLHALIDMARIQGELREEIVEKLKDFSVESLLDDPRYPQLKWHGPILISGPDGDESALLDAWGEYDSNVISAWIIAPMSAEHLSKHLRRKTFAYGADKTQYLLSYYDPLIMPILHRLADKRWVYEFFYSITAWWYPVSTPQEETWSRIGGRGAPLIFHGPPLVVSEELWDALVVNPLPYQILNYANENLPDAFEHDCYGVRLAKIEELLKAGGKSGLENTDDLYIYALSLLRNPASADDTGWQEAMKNAVCGKETLRSYLASIGE